MRRAIGVAICLVGVLVCAPALFEASQGRTSVLNGLAAAAAGGLIVAVGLGVVRGAAPGDRGLAHRWAWISMALVFVVALAVLAVGLIALALGLFADVTSKPASDPRWLNPVFIGAGLVLATIGAVVATVVGNAMRAARRGQVTG